MHAISCRGLIIPDRRKPLKQLVEMSWIRRENSSTTFRDALYYTAIATTLFNSSAWTLYRCARGVEKALLFLVFFALSFIAILAVICNICKTRYRYVDTILVVCRAHIHDDLWPSDIQVELIQ